MSGFETARWFSERMGRESTLNRWGIVGQPVLVFPTAGGDAGEIERFHLVGSVKELMKQGRIKIYSVDSVAGQAWITQEGSPAHRMWLQNQFHQYIRHEVVPAIHKDCNGEIPIWCAGASIGAFHSTAMVCRFPDVFTRALAMSGSYNLMRFIEADHYTADYFVSNPLEFMHTLSGPHLDRLRQNFICMPSGAGRAENMGESWAMAHELGRMGVPNRVDPWGPQWHHDWPTWRKMLPLYLDDWTS